MELTLKQQQVKEAFGDKFESFRQLGEKYKKANMSDDAFIIGMMRRSNITVKEVNALLGAIKIYVKYFPN